MVEEEEEVVVLAPPDASPLSSLTFRSGMQREGETRGRRIVDNYGQRGHSAKQTRSLLLSPPAGRFRHALLVPLALSLRPFWPQQAFPCIGRSGGTGKGGGGQNRLLMIII